MNLKQCESPIEAIFLTRISPLVGIGVDGLAQFAIRKRRVDFYFRCKNCNIVIECDGKEFHDYREDMARDIELFKSGEVDQIVCLRGADIRFQIDNCIEFLKKMSAPIFSESGQLPSLQELYYAGVNLRAAEYSPIIRQMIPFGQPVPEMHFGSHYLIRLEVFQEKKMCAVECKSERWSRDYHGPTMSYLSDEFTVLAMGLK